MIRKEAWPFYRTISGVRLYWVLEEPNGPKGTISFDLSKMISPVEYTPDVHPKLKIGCVPRALPGEKK